ncbi:MAG: radical SAM protein [Planctomycetota bacterium]|jgi:MoaA/NifB/PqqE/SkfB family radical SAM enzyme
MLQPSLALHIGTPSFDPERPMINLSSALSSMVQLQGSIPRRMFPSGRAFSPIHMFLEVTYRCNLRCNFCQYLDIIKGEVSTVGPVKEFKTEEIKKAIDEFPNGRLITFSGGETLVRKDFPDVLRYASKSHRTHIISNGALIKEEIAELYTDLAPKRVWNNGLVLVGISLEGDEERHDEVVGRRGSYKRTLEGIRHMVRLRKEKGKLFPKYNLKMVVTEDTVHGMVDFMHLASDLGMDLVNFMAEHDLVGHSATLISDPLESRLNVPQPRPEGVDPEFLRQQLIRCYELESELGVQIRLTPPGLPIDEFVRHYTDDRELSPDEYVCESPWARIQLTADGRYSPCYYLRTGDSRQETMQEVWNGDDFKQFRRAIKQDRIYSGCNGCCNLKYVGDKKYGLAGVNGQSA